MDKYKALEIEKRAKDILHSYGYHSGDLIDYENAVEILIDVLTE